MKPNHKRHIIGDNSLSLCNAEAYIRRTQITYANAFEEVTCGSCLRNFYRAQNSTPGPRITDIQRERLKQRRKARREAQKMGRV